MKRAIILLLVTGLHAQAPKQVCIVVSDMSSYGASLATSSVVARVSRTGQYQQTMKALEAVEGKGTVQEKQQAPGSQVLEQK